MLHGRGAIQSSHRHGDVLIHWARLYDIGIRLWGRRGRRWRTDLAGRLDLGPGNRVLDVACGTGRLAFELAGHVSPDGTVDGVDAATEMVNRARGTNDRLRLPIRFQTALAQRLPFPDDTFDAVTCTLALHHIAHNDRDEAINEIWRVLRPGGRLLIADFQTPTSLPTRYLARLLFGHAMAERPLDQATDLLRDAGFVGVTRDNTTTSWIGLVIGAKPWRSPKACIRTGIRLA
jgi:ubiquinone/menaquinone biosynthesis C-methylase UbiE